MASRRQKTAPRRRPGRTIFRISVLERGKAPGFLGGLQLAETADLVEIVRHGAPFSDVEALGASSSLTVEEISEGIAVPRRTLGQRKQSGKLKPDESDRLVRLARLWSAALALHEGDREAAHHWFTAPNAALAGQSPLEFARTEVGAREVEDLIGRLEHGVF